MKVINNYKITILIFLVILNIGGTSCFFVSRNKFDPYKNAVRGINNQKDNIYIKINKKLFINSIDKAISLKNLEKKDINELNRLKKVYSRKLNSDLINFNLFYKLQNQYPKCFFENAFIKKINIQSKDTDL